MKVKVKNDQLVIIDDGMINDDNVVKIPLELVASCTWNKEFYVEHVIPALSKKGHYDILQAINGAKSVTKVPGAVKKSIVEEHVDVATKNPQVFGSPASA